MLEEIRIAIAVGGDTCLCDRSCLDIQCCAATRKCCGRCSYRWRKGVSDFTGWGKFFHSTLPKFVVDALGQNYFQRVTELDLFESEATEIGMLKDLPHLKTLNLLRVEVTDFSPISTLRELQELDLEGTHQNDLSMLTNCTELRYLSLRYVSCDQENLSLWPLAELKNLRRLELCVSPVTDIEPLRGLQELRALSLNCTGVRSIEPIGGLANLKTLSLEDHEIEDAEVLLSMELEQLDLESPDDIDKSIFDQLIKQKTKISTLLKR